MSVRRPSKEQLRAVANELHFDLASDELDLFHALVATNFRALDALDGMPDFLPSVVYPRTPGLRPPAHQNPHNGWYVRSKVKGAPEGKLLGKTIALKDNICLAGVPMMNGSSTLEGYMPDVDATVVTRILDAGGTILGKTNCEHFCLSAGSHTNPTGPTHNPHRRGYTTGGSSSGSAAVVAAGDVDMALGGDQGGSIRVPASHCGIYGLKPTHGLVPYSGIMSVEMTLDHVGPMTRSVAENALLLEVIAGPDGLDPRQQRGRHSTDYRSAVGIGVESLRVGILAEGFGHGNSEPDVDEKVRAAAQEFGKLGATVEEVSVPLHALAPALWLTIAAEGGTAAMMNGNVFGTGWKGLYVTSLRDAHAGWRHRANQLSDPLKIVMLLGQYLTTHHGGHFYAKAQNLSRLLSAAYDKAFASYDLLLLPTSPAKAQPIPDSSRTTGIAAAVGSLANTCAFNVSGHPAMSVPCGMSDGLPVGMMLVAKPFGEHTLYRAAGGFERCVDWTSQQ
jgi:amidase